MGANTCFDGHDLIAQYFFLIFLYIVITLFQVIGQGDAAKGPRCLAESTT